LAEQFAALRRICGEKRSEIGQHEQLPKLLA